MKHLRSWLAALLMIAGITPAIAQQFPTVPSGTVIGRTLAGTGPAQAIPFSTLVASLLGSSLTIPTINTNSIVFAGGTSGQASISAQSTAGTPTIKWPTTSGTVPTSATSPILLNSTTGIISCPTCATSTAAASPIVASRALAQTLNLSSFAGLVTAGYAAAGDGGGATFVKTAATSFNDSTVLTGNISNAGSGCTNGTYLGVPFSGGTGIQFIANVTVAGGIVTVVTPRKPTGNAYTVGDVLTIPSATIGCANARWTVASISTATGSFTDSVGTKFQIVVDAGNFPNVRQFGAKLNWINSTGDAGATDDSAAFASGLVFANYGVIGIANGGSQGSTLQVPSGTALVCSTLIIPEGVTLSGLGPFASVIKQCDSSTAVTINLGDPSVGVACFGPRLSNIQIFAGSGTPAAGIAQVFTNCAQQQIAIDNVTIYSRAFECFRAVTGYGGAANLTLNGLFCTVSSASVDGLGIVLNYGAAVTTLTNSIVESGAAFTGLGVSIPATSGGVFRIDGFHCEQVNTCINWSATSSGALLDVQHATGGAAPNCVNVITRQNTAVANQMRVGVITPNGCTTTVNNGGTPTTGNIVANTNF